MAMETPGCCSSKGRSFGPAVQTTSDTDHPLPCARTRDVGRAIFTKSSFTPRAYNRSSMVTIENALIASGLAAEIPEGSDIYGWLIGSWHLDILRLGANGAETRGTGQAHFGRVLEGRAVQDVWIMPTVYGTTLRVWDPSIAAWRVTWVNPVSGARDELIGRRIGDRIVQIGTHADRTPIRWIFSAITQDSFLW